MAMFTLHPTLAADTVTVMDGPLSRILLLKDCHYPWLVLVPRRDDLTELADLDVAEQQTLMKEIVTVSAIMKRVTGADKMNVATLGNIVPQLHVHIIARFTGDPAWPRPVWGAVPACPYTPESLVETVKQWQNRLDGSF